MPVATFNNYFFQLRQLNSLFNKKCREMLKKLQTSGFYLHNCPKKLPPTLNFVIPR